MFQRLLLLDTHALFEVLRKDCCAGSTEIDGGVEIWVA